MRVIKACISRLVLAINLIVIIFEHHHSSSLLHKEAFEYGVIFSVRSHCNDKHNATKLTFEADYIQRR